MGKRFAATVLVIAVSLLGAAYRARAEGQVDPGYDAYSVTRYEGNRAIGAQGAAPSGPPGYGTAPVGDPGRSTAGYYGSAQAGSNGSGYGYGAPAGGAYGGAPSDPYATIRAGAAPGVDYRAPDTLGTGRNYYDDLYVRRRLVERYPVERGQAAALSVGSTLINTVFFPVKLAVGIVGAEAGGFAGAMNGGDEEAAAGIWNVTTDGSYFVTPRILDGREPFYWGSDEE
ncbi:MAG: hypothetical protein RL698_3013 [Pseudomonadota bacterium]|jgi:hypothetical protein